MAQDDESWFSEDELEQTSTIPLDSIALDGLIRGHDPAVWAAHLARQRVSLSHLPQPQTAESPPVGGEESQGWGLGPAGATLGAMGAGEVLAVFGEDGLALHLAQALALQVADGLALAAARTLRDTPTGRGRGHLITPTLVLCGAGAKTATLSFVARCGVASLPQLLGPSSREHDHAVRRCLEAHEGVRDVMRHVRNDEVLRGSDLLDSLHPRLSGFVADVRARAELAGHPRQAVRPVVVLTLASAWLGRGQDEHAFVGAFTSMVRHAGAIGIIGSTCPGPMHQLCDIALRIDASQAGATLSLAHHRSLWPRTARFGLEFDEPRALVTVVDPGC